MTYFYRYLLIFVIALLLPACGSAPKTPPPDWQYPGQNAAANNSRQGTINFDNGAIWRGQVRNGRMHGTGTMTWPNGSKYVGEARNGTRTGLGVYTWPDGRRYTGGFRKLKLHGYGVMEWKSGRKFSGIYVDGKRNGPGVTTLTDGTRAVGSFKDGESHGSFTVTLPDGRVYAQHWNMGKRVSASLQRPKHTVTSDRMPSGHLWRKASE